jgi:hypothetical protein
MTMELRPGSRHHLTGGVQHTRLHANLELASRPAPLPPVNTLRPKEEIVAHSGCLADPTRAQQPGAD